MDCPEPALRDAVETGDRLGRVGDLKGARAAYERAIESGHPEWAPEAAIKMGDLFAARGARSLALRSYERAINLGGDEWVRQGRRRVAELVGTSGVEGGKTSAEKSPSDASSDDSTDLVSSLREKWPTTLPRELPSWAAVELADQLRKDGDISGAQVVYTHAIDYDHGNSSQRSVALTYRGNLRWRLEDFVGARADFQNAMDARDRKYAPAAAVMLGSMLYWQGDLTGAQAAYQYAIDSKNSFWASEASVRLGNLLGRQGDIAAARTALQKAVTYTRTDAAAKAQELLDNLEDVIHRPSPSEIAAARTALEKELTSTHHDTPAEAQELLDTLEDDTTREDVTTRRTARDFRLGPLKGAGGAELS